MEKSKNILATFKKMSSASINEKLISNKLSEEQKQAALEVLTLRGQNISEPTPRKRKEINNTIFMIEKLMEAEVESINVALGSILDGDYKDDYSDIGELKENELKELYNSHFKNKKQKPMKEKEDNEKEEKPKKVNHVKETKDVLYDKEIVESILKEDSNKKAKILKLIDLGLKDSQIAKETTFSKVFIYKVRKSLRSE